MSGHGRYARKINAVIDHIAAHPDRCHSLGELARIAHLSKFHFHRVFKAVSGETVGACVNRLRLEAAAGALLYQGGRPVTDIAYGCGFSSPANFTRAFSTHFGRPPTRYRSENRRGAKFSKIGKAAQGHARYVPDMSPTVTIVTEPLRHLACLRSTGPYVHDDISALFERLLAWGRAAGHVDGTPELFGITWSDSHVADAETWRFDACVAVRPGVECEGDIVTRRLEGGLTARLSCNWSPEQPNLLQDCWDWLLGAWMPQSGYIPASGPAYERYGTDEGACEFEVTLCLPLARPDGARP